MRKVLLSIFFIALTFSVAAKPDGIDCASNFKKHFDEGKALYAKGKYKEAIRAFDLAVCPSLTATQSAELDDWAKKCKNGLNKTASRKPKPSDKGPIIQPQEKPEAEVIYAGVLRTTCEGDARGAEIELLITAKNLKDNKLRLCSFIAPLKGSGKVNDASPLASQYTLEGGFSGLEQEIQFADGEVCTSVKVFVPFSVMDFAGDYSAQILKADYFVYLSGEKTPIAHRSEKYESILPYTISLWRQINDYDKEVDYLGGLLLDFGGYNLATCGGDIHNLLWQDVPEWVVIDEKGLHVTENTSSSSRFASIGISSKKGGNVIRINITQNGRSEGDLTTATINKAWLEEIMRNPAQNLKQLNVHVACEIVGASNKEVTLYAYFYCPDGTTPLLDDKDEQVVAWEKVFCDYAESAFDDIVLPMWLNSVTNAKNNKEKEARYYILISEDDGQSWIGRYGPYTIKW